MMRFLYRCLLWLHPAPFRQQYAGEMLWIFDEAAGAGGVAPFFTDGLISLGRQWVLRSGAWTMAAGAVGAFVLIGGMLSMAAFPIRQIPIRDVDDFPVHASSGPPGRFDGHWAGYFLFPGPAGQMEFTLSQENGLWSGDLQVRGVDGVLHPGVAEDIQVGPESLSFRFKTNQGDMDFQGRMIQGRLKAYVRPIVAATSF
jgi:hypothetical protein